MTFPQWKELANTLHPRAERLTHAIVQEARRTAQHAGLDPMIPFLHAHNALCGLETGHPWPEVNYSLCRRVLWLEQRSYVPRRLVDSILSKAWARVQMSTVTQGR